MPYSPGTGYTDPATGAAPAAPGGPANGLFPGSSGNTTGAQDTYLGITAGEANQQVIITPSAPTPVGQATGGAPQPVPGVPGVGVGLPGSQPLVNLGAPMVPGVSAQQEQEGVGIAEQFGSVPTSPAQATTVGEALTQFLQSFTADQVAQLGQVLYEDGFFDSSFYGASKKPYTTHDIYLAYKNALLTAATTGQDLGAVLKQGQDRSQAIGLTGPGSTGAAGAAKAPSIRYTATLTNPDDLGNAMDLAAEKLLGRKATDAEKAAFVKDYQAKELSTTTEEAQSDYSQRTLGQAGLTTGGGTVVPPLDPKYMTAGTVDQGVDYAAPGGTPLTAVGGGTISIVSDPSGFGPTVVLLHVTDGPLAGQTVYYGHAQIATLDGGTLVHEGDTVTAGQQIAYVGFGNVGASTGPHLEVGLWGQHGPAPKTGAQFKSVMDAAIAGASPHPAASGPSGDVVSIITSVANELGVDPKLAIAIAQEESGLDPTKVGDSGTSFGLFQLHQGGELGDLTPDQAKDPTTNARVALAEVAAVAKAHPDWSPGQIAAAAQRPTDPTGYATAVNSLYANPTTTSTAASGSLAATGGGGPIVVPHSPPATPDVAAQAAEKAANPNEYQAHQLVGTYDLFQSIMAGRATDTGAARPTERV